MSGRETIFTEAVFQGSSLCVVGNINRDIKTSPIPTGPQLLGDGETSVASILETIGGGGANSAFAAAALGATVSFLGKVGADTLGKRLELTLEQSGIVAHLAKDGKNASGTSLALTFQDGERHFISCLPASRALTFADLNLDALSACEHLLRADVWFSESMLFEGNKALFQAAREKCVPVSIDINWDPGWRLTNKRETAARKQAVRDVLPWVNLAHGNVRELVEFADAPNLETALARITDWGAGAIVVHLGAQGAGYYHDGVLVTEAPVPATVQVNATGTGDVLSVCMMLLHQQLDVPVAQRLRLANTIVSQFIEGRRQLIPPLAA